MNDYIKRSDALNRFKEIKESGVSLKDSVYLDGVMAVIENLPAADVAPVVHARWADGSHGDAKCPVCGREDMERNYNYCPNCGAKMDE